MYIITVDDNKVKTAQGLHYCITVFTRPRLHMQPACCKDWTDKLAMRSARGKGQGKSETTVLDLRFTKSGQGSGRIWPA